ncbi:hypothetical protein EV182_000788 [Spiromyces aspiralis]|uniref:Uncharacterized protein n=1 Tax=Spiromyces aspiralis TaxID=68401 RepID=A0ACC1I1N6_9FUNG|nr:hypothetical protein EV182_000788 [Spiromyces aspiralis]
MVQEFIAWLLDLKGLHFEELSPASTKKYFREYMEDYNTSTLPHEKYYDLQAWEAKEREAGGKGAKPLGVPSVGDGEMDLLRDQDAVRSSTTLSALTLSRDQLMDLRRVQQERVEAEKLRQLGFKAKDSMGVRYDTIR